MGDDHPETEGDEDDTAHHDELFVALAPHSPEHCAPFDGKPSLPPSADFIKADCSEWRDEREARDGGDEPHRLAPFDRRDIEEQARRYIDGGEEQAVDRAGDEIGEARFQGFAKIGQ